MSDSSALLEKIELKLENTTDTKIKGLPYFIEIQKASNKTVRIPCSNEAIGNKILEGFAKLKSALKAI